MQNDVRLKRARIQKGRLSMMQEASADYRISIRSLLLRPDESRTLSKEIDLETARSYGLPCQAPPTVEGLLENRAGVLIHEIQGQPQSETHLM